MISLEKITKEYDLVENKLQALSNVSLSIKKGEYISIMGPSGSGKSTLMHILGILDTGITGSYMLEGYDIVTLPDREQARIRNKHFGFIFQSFNLFSEMSALENVMVPMHFAGVRSSAKKAKAMELLDQVGLSERIHHLPTMMSGGEQQRVAIARALANSPDLILADEPTGNLPKEKGEEVLAILEGLNKQGVTIITVTHNLEQGQRAGRLINILDGKLLEN